MKKPTLTIALALLALAAPATASAAPSLNLDLHHSQTNFPPGGNQADAFAAVSTQTNGSAAENEKQSINTQATSGTFKLGFDPDGAGPLPAESTTDIALLSSAAAVQAALEALPAIGAGNVSVVEHSTGEGPTGDHTVTFTGALANTDVAELTATDGATPLAIDPEYWIDIHNVGPDPTSGPIRSPSPCPRASPECQSTPAPMKAPRR
jgi:hypothetical protein